MRMEFGPWLPDLPPLKLQGGLTVCEGVVPVAGGYGPVSRVLALDAFAVSAAPRGAVRGQLHDGTNFFVAGTESTLELKRLSSWDDVSRSAGYTPITDTRWSMLQFANYAFAANYKTPLQSYNLSSSSTFEDVIGAPRAAHIASAENFLWAGDCYFNDIGVARDAVAWSAQGNPVYWPDVTTDDATAVLSGRQRLEGNGGIVQAVVSGSEVVAIFQENAIWRADFVGNDIVWQFNRVESDHGCSIAGAAIDVERGVFFIAQDGFRLFDYTRSVNIGKDRVNDFFFADYDNDYPDSVSLTRDPQETRIYVSYAATDSTGGAPNRVIIWDYVLDQWSLLKPGTHYALIPSGGIAAHLDSPNIAGDQDTLQGTAGGGFDDDYGAKTFDARVLGAGRVAIGCFDASFQQSSFSGVPYEGTLTTGDLELSPGHRSLLTAVRPQVDGEETTLQVSGSSRRADETVTTDYSLASPMEPDGNCYVRVDARYHRLQFNLSSYFTEATVFDVEARPTGKR